MKKNKQKSESENNFKVFVDEHSPEQTMQIQRQWRKHAEQRKSTCYTRIMIAVIIAMVILFILLINFLSSKDKKLHSYLQYSDSNFVLIQTPLAHLKILVIESYNTVQTRLMKALGIVVPEVIMWIEANLKENMKVLFIPNQNSGVNLIGMALGYNLLQSRGGRLDIIAQRLQYRDLTNRNMIELKKQHKNSRFPIKLLAKAEYNDIDYDLIVIENNNFHQNLKDVSNSSLIIIRKQGQLSSIIDAFFHQHNQYQIIKGKSTEQIRKDQKWSGYAIIPYILSQKAENNNILLLPDPLEDVSLCPEDNQLFIGLQEDRNAVQYFRNKTFNQAAIYYELQNLNIIKSLLSFAQIKKVSVKSGSNYFNKSLPKIDQIDQINHFQRKTTNYLLIEVSSIVGLKIEPNDKILIKITRNQDLFFILNQVKPTEYNIMKISPFNNNGCFYPPQISWFQSKIYINPKNKRMMKTDQLMTVNLLNL